MTVVICPHCSAQVPAGFKFCGECGNKLTLQAASPAAPAAVVPAQVTPAAPRAQKRDEFRDVTVLFADVTGFTALSEHLDPEALHALMNECFDGLGRIVQNHGGHIDKYIGDSIMALFGAPTAHEDDPVRAGEAALAMQAFLGSFKGPGSSQSQPAFRMRIGINCGLVLAGSIGTEGKRDYSVMGDAVNTASRLEGQAAPGTILVSDAFKRRVERQFQFTGPREYSLKGKDRPVTGWQLIREGGDDAAQSATAPRRFFTGRQAEIAQIVGLFSERAAHGKSLWIDIRGPLGIGKTHLVEEALRHLPGRAALHVVSRPATRLRPFALARRTLLAIAAHLTGRKSPAQSREEFLSALVPVSQDLQPYETALWYLAAPDSLSLKVPDPDPLTFRRTVERGLERLLANIAEQLPQAVLVLDAFDLADAETMRFFEAAYRAGTRRLPPVIATARTEEKALRQSTAIVGLGPLAPRDAEFVALHAASGSAIDTPVLRSILNRAQGVPLFILELVRSILEDAPVADGGPGQMLSSLPSSLLGVMSSRLDRLDVEKRDALAQCAAQGIEFSADVALLVWRERGGQPEALALHLKDLEDRAFIEATDRETRRYAFSQALMQNACYDSMLKRDRRTLHKDVAAALILQSGGVLSVSPELLSTHYELSEQWLDAAMQNLRAGNRAADLYANADAIARYERALKALAEHGEKGEPERRLAFDAHRGAALVHLRVGRYIDVERDASAMLTQAHDVHETAEAVRLKAQSLLHRGDLNSAGDLLMQAEHSLDELLVISSHANENGGVACHVFFDLADLSFRKGNNDNARGYIARCRSIVPAACPELLRLDILEGRVAHTEGRFKDAVDLYRRAHASAAGAGSLSEEALTSNYMGNAARDVGHYEDAERYFACALDIWTRVGLTESIAGAHNNLANLAISRGDAARAELHYGLALNAFEEIANAAGTALARTNLAILAIEQNRPADGLRNAAEAKALLQASGNRMLLGLASVVRGEALLAAGDALEAEKEFAWILSEYERSNHPLAVAGARRGQGRAALVRGDTRAALTPLSEALSLYELLAREQEAGRTELFLARAFELAGDHEQARQFLRSAYQRFDRIGAKADLARADAALSQIAAGE